MSSKFGNFDSSWGWYVKFRSAICHKCFILITCLSLGEVLLLILHLILHYLDHLGDYQFSLAHYTYQIVFDFAKEKRGGEPVVPLPEMPSWC